ncbi:MAG TPA: MBL fold metallo-hydrolase [Chthonomonadales bacterium]|nr:MBL fold metallo-hydrolase [Chthonomonadales bacterium]
MEVLVLGSGTSHGVPMIGCRCPVCTSPDPRNRRFRPSIAVRVGEHAILVDATPELRMQALTFGLERVDAVLVTHTHADHIMGLDDIRRFNDLRDAEIPVYGDAQSIDDILRIFRYVFAPTQAGGGKPRISLHKAPDRFELFGLPICALRVYHGSLPILAYRFGRYAYVTDVSRIPPETMEALRGLDTLMLDTVRMAPHETHFGLQEALDVVAELRPRRTYLTHLSHHYDHEATNALLPPGVELAYDGLTLRLDGPA